MRIVVCSAPLIASMTLSCGLDRLVLAITKEQRIRVFKFDRSGDCPRLYTYQTWEAEEEAEEEEEQEEVSR